MSKYSDWTRVDPAVGLPVDTFLPIWVAEKRHGREWVVWCETMHPLTLRGDWGIPGLEMWFKDATADIPAPPGAEPEPEQPANIGRIGELVREINLDPPERTKAGLLQGGDARRGVHMSNDYTDWTKIDPAVGLPKNRGEILTLNTNQGNVAALLRWDAVHERWLSKGEPVLDPQATHWTVVPAPPGAEPKPEDPKCESCAGTGFYGDNVPGIIANNEYHECDCPAGAKVVAAMKGACAVVGIPWPPEPAPEKPPICPTCKNNLSQVYANGRWTCNALHNRVLNLAGRERPPLDAEAIIEAARGTAGWIIEGSCQSIVRALVDAINARDAGEGSAGE